MSKFKFRKLTLKNIFWVISSILVVFAFSAFMAKAFLKIQSGHGLEYYLSGKGFQFNYLVAFLTLSLIPVFLSVGWIIGKILVWREKRIKKRMIQKKLNKRKRETQT